MPFGGALIAGIGGLTSLFGGLFGSNAANKAATQQVNAGNQAVDFEKQVYGDQKSQQQPYLDFGASTLQQLMKGIQNGTFGQTADFQAPTLQQARDTPGYQFALEQGQNGILKTQAALGGALGGGTAKALEGYGVNLADTTYNNRFQQALQGYQTNLQKNAQDYSQLFAPVQLGENATAQIGNVGSGTAKSIADIMQGIGNAQASGTIGSANAITGGLTGVTNSVTNGLLLNQLMNPKPAPARASA